MKNLLEREFHQSWSKYVTETFAQYQFPCLKCRKQSRAISHCQCIRDRGMKTACPRPPCSPLPQYRGVFWHRTLTWQVGNKKAGHNLSDLLSLLSSRFAFLLPTNPYFDHTPTATQIFEFSNSFSGFSEALEAWAILGHFLCCGCHFRNTPGTC